MPDAEPVAVCKAIATSLAGGSFSQSVDVNRSYVPAYDIEDLQSTAQVTVLNNGYRRNVLTRNKSHVVISILARVMVEKSVTKTDVTEIDAMVLLTEEIRDHLEDNEFDGAHFAPEEETPDILDIYDPEALQQDGIFRAQIDILLRKA